MPEMPPPAPPTTLGEVASPEAESRRQEAEAEVLQAIRECKSEADQARRRRLQKNKQNWRAYLGEQDWSHKVKGQSREFLPKVPMAVEQLAAFVKRGLVAYSDWFSVTSPPGPLAPEEIRRLLMHALETADEAEPGRLDFPTIVSDAVKVGALGSLMVLKIHGRHFRRREFRAESGLRLAVVGGQVVPQMVQRLRPVEGRTWQLLIDLVRPEDYYPDPTGRGLYEVHEVERDLADVQAWAEDGPYDPEVVAQLEADFAQAEEAWQRARQANQDYATAPAFRKRVVITEFWGTLLDRQGRVRARNVVCTMANDKYLLRRRDPETGERWTANPLWHQQSPFVAAPLIRVPFSVWHKALADHMTPLNIALNELYSLILDGGVAAVWGTRQVRPGWLEDPRQISDGIPQGATLTIKDEVPPGGKAIEVVATGAVPQDAIATYNITERNFFEAALTNDLKMGMLPPRAVKATEVLEASQGQTTTLDGLSKDIEKGWIEPTLRKAWLTLLQFADDLPSDEVVAAMGARGALALARMSPAERFAAYSGAKFQVSGLSATLARARDFQKLMALQQAIATNPLLMQAFLQRFSPAKVLTHILRTLNIDPGAMEQDPAEQAAMPGFLQRLPMFQQLAGGRGAMGAQPPAGPVGEPGLPGEIGQLNANPFGGGVG